MAVVDPVGLNPNWFSLSWPWNLAQRQLNVIESGII